MKQFSLSLRLAIGFGLVLGLLLLIAGVGYGSFLALERSAERYHRLSNVGEALSEMQLATLSELASDSERRSDKTVAEMQAAVNLTKEVYSDADDLKDLEKMGAAVGAISNAVAQGNIKADPASKARAQALSAAAHQVMDVYDGMTERELEEAKGIKERARQSLFLGVLISFLIGAAMSYYLTVNISRPISGVIAGLAAGASEVNAAAGEVAKASQSLAQGATEQASALEETSASLEEIASMTKQSADNAQHANTLSKEAEAIVGEANQAMMELTKSMGEMRASAEQTSKIIKTIDEIAFQTNLLALNAAVEAARAGEHGAGFAVVADEVRNLAMRAATAAKNTSELIEDSVTNILRGGDLVSKTNVAFQSIHTGTTKVGQLVDEIAAAAKEQSAGIQELNRAVAEMDKVMQHNASGAEESSAAAEELTAQAAAMQNFVIGLEQVVKGAK